MSVKRPCLASKHMLKCKHTHVQYVQYASMLMPRYLKQEGTSEKLCAHAAGLGTACVGLAELDLS